MTNNSFVSPDLLQSEQLTNKILMVRPVAFGSNPETAKDNAFQHIADPDNTDAIADQARIEFDAFIMALRAAGVEVFVVEDTPEPRKIDAVFPNNWISTHDDGLIITYPMLSDIRKLERRPEVVDMLAANFSVSRLVNLTAWEEQDLILEGTGSLILDRQKRIAYAGLSKRTDLAALKQWAELMRFEVCAFHATDKFNQLIYHTNVMMSVGQHVAIVCLESIKDADERTQLLSTLEKSGKKVVDISLEQVAHFAGNALEVMGRDHAYWVMSSQAYQALSADQMAILREDGAHILHSPLDTIEAYGGGSARCMMAEIFLPMK